MSKISSATTFEEDRADVLDNPEWTAEDFARAKPFAEVFPDLAREVRGAQKAPKKLATSIRANEPTRQRSK